MISTTQFPLQGRHNLLNAMAAVSVARLLDISKDSIRESLLSFTKVEHRLEQVLKIQNRTYINDSKNPSYIMLNNGLFWLYIIVALYVIYKVLTGMITQNIYGKLIIILLISLYPIYISGLELSIYNQYLFIKAMIRSEPYVPVK